MPGRADPGPSGRSSHLSIERSIRRSGRALRALVLAPALVAGGLLFPAAPPARAQSAPADDARADSTRAPAPSADTARVDSARVTYRTAEVVFFSAGRAEGVRVGDTVTVHAADGSVLSAAVVVSAAQHTASARLLTSDAAVAVGQQVRFTGHPPPPAAPALAAADTAAPPPARPDSAALADSLAADSAAAARQAAPAPLPRWRGGLQFEQLASTTGGSAAVRSYQSVGSFDLLAPLAPGVQVQVRASSRWRSGASGLATGTNGTTTTLYQLEARFGTAESGVNASLGRFVPVGAMGLGYLDGARLELRLSASQRLGVIAGFAPDPTNLEPSTRTKRAGAYWAFGGTGLFSGSLGAAADWADGARRRTVLSQQLFWQPTGRLTLSTYSEVDVGTPWQAFHGAQLTTLFANLRAELPYGFRGGVGVESHQALLLWENALAGDTLPLPGRINGVSASLGHDVLGWSVDLSGGALKRAGDASATLRGMLTLFRRSFFLTVTGMHGDLFDYGAAMARVLLPYRALPFTASLGATASFTRTPGGALTQWRFAVQPELSQGLGGGLFLSLGGDVGTYAGRASAWLHGGLSYRFR